MSCLGRERMFEHFSRTLGIPMAIIRLNYASRAALRRAGGPGADGAARGEPIDLAMGHFNAIWQADANAMALRAFDHLVESAARVERDGPGDAERAASVRGVRRRLNVGVNFAGSEAPDALLSNAAARHALFGYRASACQQMIALDRRLVRAAARRSASRRISRCAMESSSGYRIASTGRLRCRSHAASSYG